jgi:hypothetical protein
MMQPDEELEGYLDAILDAVLQMRLDAQEIGKSGIEMDLACDKTAVSLYYGWKALDECFEE